MLNEDTLRYLTKMPLNWNFVIAVGTSTDSNTSVIDP